jgi:hypothetical protein
MAATALHTAAQRDQNPLAELRRLRDLEARLRRLKPQRDWLIRQALTQGVSERKIAVASGLTPGRIHQIKDADMKEEEV